MKIILLEDVKKLGKCGDVVEVSDGYARNFILPKNLGKEASKENLSRLNDSKAKQARLNQEELDAAKELAKKVEEINLHIKVKMGNNGKLFGAVSSKEIAEELEKNSKISIDKKKIKLESPIKEVGTYKLPVKLHKEVHANLTVFIEEE